MQQLNFTKQHQQGLFSYLNLVHPYATTAHPLTGLRKELYRYQFHQYLALAAFLTEQLDTFIILKASPYTKKVMADHRSCRSNWQYHFIANDFDGMGIDRGFVRISGHEEEQPLLSQMEMLLSLREFPEDSFGDNVSHISIFGLVQNRWNDLKTFLQQEHPPVLNGFLQQEELFMNILVSKAEGYYHALLIKSPSDIEYRMNAFQNVIAPDN